MKLASETLAKLLKIIICTLLVMGLVDILLTYKLLGDPENDELFSQLLTIYIIAIIISIANFIVFLMWIFKVHVDLNRLYPDYTRSPGKALACMLIPIYNFYGIPSTFWRIGSHFKLKSENLEPEGNWIRGLAAPVLILMLLSWILYQYDSSMEEISAPIWLTESFISLIQYVIYLILTVQIQNGLKKATEEYVAPTNPENHTFSS